MSRMYVESLIYLLKVSGNSATLVAGEHGLLVMMFLTCL